jgi:hypothetical protein
MADDHNTNPFLDDDSILEEETVTQRVKQECADTCKLYLLNVANNYYTKLRIQIMSVYSGIGLIYFFNIIKSFKI